MPTRCAECLRGRCQECLCDDALEVLAEVLPVDPQVSEYACLSDDNRPSRFQEFHGSSCVATIS